MTTTPRPGCPASGPALLEELPTGRTLVMGILNVTPDSFSDGGRHAGHEAAVAHGLRMLAEGADLVDVGGESTRPGSERISPAEEQRRILPVVEALAAQGAVLSVDTLHAATAEAALDAGAHIVNDVSGAAVSPEMIELVAAGLAPERIVLDPGLCFAKRGAQNWELLRALPRFRATGHPVLVAASRKRFLGTLLAEDGVPRPAAGRDAATAALSALAAHGGAWGVRVHDVRSSADAVTTAAAWRGGDPAGEGGTR